MEKDAVRMTRRTLLAIVSFLGIPALAYGNMVWPALYVETKINSLPIIASSLALEYLAIRWLFQVGIRQSFLYTVIANLASGVIGLALRPLSGILWEVSLGQAVIFLFRWGTFNPVAWFFVPVIGGALNAGLELLCIKLVWKEKFTRRRFFAFWAVNWLTVGIATLWVVAAPPSM
ncbi:MAG TPA: hypothetical protein PKV41_04220 [Candidatus Omnitrophota bacterium]|nr:hypothetical protein [Candidatus Omnitrophota bacterium]